MPALNVAELAPDVRRRLGLKRRPAKRSMTMDQVRTAAIRVLATVADLTPSERSRVLRHAAKLNEV